MANRLMIKPVKVTMRVIDKTLHADHHLHSGKALSCRDDDVPPRLMRTEPADLYRARSAG
jgi:hypothetical protein